MDYESVSITAASHYLARGATHTPDCATEDYKNGDAAATGTVQDGTHYTMSDPERYKLKKKVTQINIIYNIFAPQVHVCYRIPQKRLPFCQCYCLVTLAGSRLKFTQLSLGNSRRLLTRQTKLISHAWELSKRFKAGGKLMRSLPSARFTAHTNKLY